MGSGEEPRSHPGLHNAKELVLSSGGSEEP